MLAEGRLDRSLRVLDRADRLCPVEAASSLETRLTTLVALGRDTDARALANTIETNRDSTAALREAATTALARIDARAHAPAHPELASAEARSLLTLARTAAKTNPSAALPLFEKAWDASHPNGTALVGAGMAAAALGRPADAQHFFDRAMVDIAKSTSAPVVAVVRKGDFRFFSPDGLSELKEDPAGTLALLDHARLVSMPLGPGGTSDAAFDREGRTLVTAVHAEAWEAPTLLRQWEAGTGREIASLSLPGHVGNLSFTRDGKTILAAGADVIAWDPPAKKPRHVFRGSHAYAVMPDERTIAISGAIPAARFAHPGTAVVESETIKLVDLASGRVLKHLTSHESTDGDAGQRIDSITSFAFSPDGGALAASLRTDGEGPRDTIGGVHLFDLPSGVYRKTLRVPPGQARGPIGVSRFSADGKHLVTVPSRSPDAVGTPEVDLWDLATGQVIEQFPLDGISPTPEWAREVIHMSEGPPLELGSDAIKLDATGRHLALSGLVVDLDAGADSTVILQRVLAAASRGQVRLLEQGALIQAEDGSFELLGAKPEEILQCRSGAFVFPYEVCAERWRAPGLLRRLLAGDISAPPP